MAIKKKKIKFGLIGCGRISKQHLNSIQFLPEAKLVAVCDIKEDRAKNVAQRYGVDWYKNYKELLQRPDIDIVSICTPNGLHAEIAIDVAKANKHALVEKPLAINLKETDEMIQVFSKMKKRLFSVLQVRFNPPLQALKKIVERGQLGRINSASLVVRWTRPQEYFDNDKWRGTKELDGGALLTQGIHYIDILQWILGPVESVFAKKDTVAHKIKIEDIVVAIAKFKNGAYATIEFTICTYLHNIECSITILGSRGSVKIGGTAVNEIEFWEVENLPKPVLPISVDPNVYNEGLYQGSCPNHIFVYKELVRYFNSSSPSQCIDDREARKSIEIVEAVYKSAEENKEIFLNEI